MKKIMITVLMVLTGIFLVTGCSNPFRMDENHASVAITTSNGYSTVIKTFNGAGMSHSGSDTALHYKSELNLEPGVTANLHFKCNACGKEETFDISEPWSQMLSCDCPEEIDKNGNAKEYCAVSISYNKEQE